MITSDISLPRMGWYSAVLEPTSAVNEFLAVPANACRTSVELKSPVPPVTHSQPNLSRLEPSTEAVKYKSVFIFEQI